MKELKIISNEELIRETKVIAAEERRIGVELLKYLREIEYRRLYAEKHSSLFEFVVHELHYSDGAAYRRVQAMKLLKDLPVVQRSLESGEVSLSTASQLQSFFRKERKLSHDYSPEQKAEMFESIKGKSSRQVERILAEKSPEAMPVENERVLSEEKLQVTMVLSKSLQEKLEKLRGLLAHQNPDPSYAELLEKLADLSLKKLDPEVVVRKTPTASTSKLGAQAAHMRFIPAPVRREIWRKAQGRCQHSSEIGMRCNAIYALEVDHIRPVGKGRKTEISNLPLLCRTHNQYKNIRNYGRHWENGWGWKSIGIKVKR